jgi:hypothetical protein
MQKSPHSLLYLLRLPQLYHHPYHPYLCHRYQIRATHYYVWLSAPPGCVSQLLDSSKQLAGLLHRHYLLQLYIVSEWWLTRELHRLPHPVQQLQFCCSSDELCDIIRETATGREGARPNCWLYPAERCTLFIKGTNITSNWKERLTQQLLDGDLRYYLMVK